MNDQQGYGWPNGFTQAHGAAPMSEPPRQRSGHGWVVGIVLVLIAVTSFALVTLLMKGKKNDAAGPASTVATAPGSAPSEGAAAASPGASASTSATFPPEAVDTCIDDSGEVPNPDADQVRMKGGAQTSCVFLRNTRAAVIEHRAAHPDEDTFSVSPWSPRNHGENIDLSCGPAGGFTYCVSANKARIWVRNP